MDDVPRILVFDHDEALLELIAGWLAEQGFQSASLRGPDFVPEAIRAAEPTLVILDLQLRCPRGDLPNLSRLAAAGAGRRPVVLLLTATDAAMLHQAVEIYREQPALLVDGIVKPFDLDDLLSKIRRLLDARMQT